MHRVLDAALQGQLTEARHLLANVRDALTRFGASDEDQAALAASIRQLDEFFLLVVVGEFNAGKSAFINALAGQRVLQEGVTPTTSQIHVLRHGDDAGTVVDEHGIRVVTAPVELLRDVHIVDTPGTNAIIREHERLTAEFMPRSDLVIFVTSADRPFTETERGFLEAIRDWGKKIVIVVNKVDIFEREAELSEVVGFVRDSARRLLGITPEVFPVSARFAMRAKQGEPSLWDRSGFSCEDVVDGKTPGTSAENASWLAALVMNRARATAAGWCSDWFETDSPCTYSGVSPMYGEDTILPSSDGLLATTLLMKLPPPVDQATLPSVKSWPLPR